MLAAVDGHPDLIPAEKLAAIKDRTGGRPEELSPYHHLRQGLPPTIIFHGTDDEAVPFATAELFAASMRDLGNRCELKAYEGQPHGFFNPGRGKGPQRAAATQRYYETMQQGLELSASGYLVKPFEIAELVANLEHALQRGHSHA